MKPHPNLEPYTNLHAGRFWFDSQLGQKALLLVHGNGDEADTWRHIFVPLSKHFRVIAPDLPGFGRSQSGVATLLGFAQWLHELVAHLGLKKIHLLGSSLGGAVAANFAALYPDQTSSLGIIGGASPALGNLHPSQAVKPLLEPGVGEAFYNNLRETDPEVAYATLRPYYHNLEALPKSDQDFLRQRVWERVQSNTQRDAFFAALRSLFAPAPPLKIQTPTQLLWGQFDQIVPLDHGKIIQQQLSNTRLAIVQNAGHLPHQEQPNATLQLYSQNFPH
jgi:pimeloyl-ACP methyl ester carboxylesterase